jgi:hypothetical protein
MRLPARLPWTTPLRQKIELAETRDTSRGNLLGRGRQALGNLSLPALLARGALGHRPQGQPSPGCCGRKRLPLAAPLVLAIHFLGRHTTNSGPLAGLGFFPQRAAESWTSPFAEQRSEGPVI